MVVLSLQNSKGMTLFEQFCFLSLRHLRFNWETYQGLLEHREQIRDQRDLVDMLRRLAGVFLTAADFILLEQDVLDLEKNNVSWCTPEDAIYPSIFRDYQTGPLCLSYLGRPIWKDWNWLAVVGSRTPFRETLTWLDLELPKIFEIENLSILSGGARGVDQKAHAICLRLKKPTICIVPSGLGALYPSELEKWVEPILRYDGCVMSGFSYRALMNKSHFHIRNRWIVRLSQLVLVAQAARKSGSAMTGKIAMETLDGDQVYVLPCSPLNRQGLGGLDLICDGAQVARDGLDLMMGASRVNGSVL